MKKLLGSCCFILLLLPRVLWAELTIEITHGVDNPTPIAIVPFGGAQLPRDAGKIVSDDLLRSGLFRPIPRTDMLSFPVSARDVYFRDWRLLGAEYLLVADTAVRSGNYEITYSLLQVHSGKTVFTKIVKGPGRLVRGLAHRISDEVYEAITGVRGAFSTRVAYVTATGSGQDIAYRLMVSDADGAREGLMLKSKEPIMSPTWAPNGKELAYVSFESGRPAIYRQSLSTAKREKLTDFKGLNGAPSWSPDGRKLAMVLSKDGNPEIYMYDLQTRQFTRLTRHFSIDTEPNWMPDGKSLIFTSDRGGNPQIYKLTVADKRVERLTFNGNYNARPRLAQDGRTLVMVHRNNGRFHIASQDLKTGDLRVLTQTYLDESPTVAPNGAMLLYATKQGKKGVLAAVSLDAGVKFFLPARRGDVREPAWSPFLN